VLQASNQGTPAIHGKGSDVSEAYKDVIDRFLGEDKPCASSRPKSPASSSACSGGHKPCLLPDLLLGEKKKTASVAKERLQIILAHERSGRNAAEPDYLPALQRELVAVISKYIKINPDDIKVNLERQDNLEVLEVKIELPDRPLRAIAISCLPASMAAWRTIFWSAGVQLAQTSLLAIANISGSAT
jgi:cell division topological specificity factor